MDCSVNEAPLDHSFQKERRSLASKGSLGKRRRPSRYDIRNSVTGLGDSFNLDCEKESQDFSENCTKGSSKVSSSYDDSTLSEGKTSTEHVKRKREPSKSAVLIQTWERRSQTEKNPKLQSTISCSRDAKPFYNGPVTTEKQSGLRLPLQEHRMLESPFDSQHCASRFHHSATEEANFIYGDCSGKEPRKWRPETDLKNRGRTTEVTGKINDEPEWISLSKKLCAKFIKSHLESSNNDISKNHQNGDHIIHAKSKAEKNVSDTSKKAESSGCKEPQWVLLSKKLCTKFLEEHIAHSLKNFRERKSAESSSVSIEEEGKRKDDIDTKYCLENCKEISNPASVQEVQREAMVTQKFHKVSTNYRVQQREEPEWISLSRKLRAKFIEGHLDDPDKVSFDTQLNASDLEESFSVPTLAQKYLDYRNQAQASCQSADARQELNSSRNLLHECSTVNQGISESLTERHKELSSSMPDMPTKHRSEEFGWDQKLLLSSSGFAYDRNVKYQDSVSNNSNEEVVRVNVDYEGFSDREFSCADSSTNESTKVSVSGTNYKLVSSAENQHYTDVRFVNESCSAKSFYHSEDSVSAHDDKVKNSVHSFCASPDNENRKQFCQNGNISLNNNAFQMRRTSPTRGTENIAVCSPFGDNGHFKQCYSDDDTFHTVDLNSNSESIDSLEMKKTKDDEQYINYQDCEFNECSAASYSRISNTASKSDCFGRNSTPGFDKHTLSTIKNVINSHEGNEFHPVHGSEEKKHNHFISMACNVFPSSGYDENEHVKNNDKIWHHQNESEGHQVHHLKLYDQVQDSNKSFLSPTAQFSYHNREGGSDATERVDKHESCVGLCEAEERLNREMHNKNQCLASEITLQEECRNKSAVQNSSIMNQSEYNACEKILHNSRYKNSESIVRTEKYERTENKDLGISSDSSEAPCKRSCEIKTSDSSEDNTASKNRVHLHEATSDDSSHQKVIVSFSVKPHEMKSTSDVPCVYPLSNVTNQLSNDINKAAANKITGKVVGSSNHFSKAQNETNHPKTNISKVFKCGNFEKPALKESAIFYRLCEDETSEKGKKSQNQESFSKRNLSESPYSDENTRHTKHSREVDIHSELLRHSPNYPMTSENINIEMVDDTKLKSSEKQREIKTRLRPLGYLSKISNSSHSTNSPGRSAAKRTDSTKSHYVDYKDEHLYMNYNQEYGKIRSKEAYHLNRCHASAPDLSKDIKKDDVKPENSVISKAESQQEIKIEKTAHGVLSLDCIIKMACSPGLTEHSDTPESESVNRVVSSKESFSQTSPIMLPKRHSGEGGFCVFDDQDYLKDSTSTSFCPSDSECSSWIMTRNNSYVINESSSLNESDVSDCSLSVKCDHLSSCSNQNTIETRGRSSSESGSYMQMRSLSKEKNLLQSAAEKLGNTTLSSEAGDGAKVHKPSCPATPESLRHLFQLPAKPFFPPTLHTSRVFISKDPPPIYASLSQSSSSSFKQNKREERGRKTDRSSSLKIRDIAQGIILTFRRFQNISSSTKQRHISPSRYVDVSHLAESNRQVPKEWFSGGNNPSINFLNGTSKKNAGHSIFTTGRPTRSQSESGGCPVNFRGQQNINSKAEKISLGKKSCSRSSSDISSQPERTTSGNTLETNGRPERSKSGDKVSDRRTKKSNKTRSQQNCGKNRTMMRPESRNVTSISRKVQQMADGTLYLVTTVSGDSSVPGFYSDSVNTTEGSGSRCRQTKAAGESNC